MKFATHIYYMSGYCWKGCHDQTN